VIDHHGRVEQQIGWERHAFDWHIDGAADDLHGGAGRDTLIMDRADRATGGAGVDTFWVYHDDATGTRHAEVMDFEPGVDFLRVTLNPVLDHGEIEVAVGASADGADGVVAVNGTVVALLRGTPGITPSDVLVEVTPDIFS
jgi:Ca2+-binding RTX toxin-like protein